LIICFYFTRSDPENQVKICQTALALYAKFKPEICAELQKIKK